MREALSQSAPKVPASRAVPRQHARIAHPTPFCLLACRCCRRAVLKQVQKRAYERAELPLGCSKDGRSKGTTALSTSPTKFTEAVPHVTCQATACHYDLVWGRIRLSTAGPMSSQIWSVYRTSHCFIRRDGTESILDSGDGERSSADPRPSELASDAGRTCGPHAQPTRERATAAREVHRALAGRGVTRGGRRDFL
jgi:hypothetical protein